MEVRASYHLLLYISTKQEIITAINALVSEFIHKHGFHFSFLFFDQMRNIAK